MNDYLLFIDTETSGLPKSWNKPYAAAGNWPFIVQVAWVVYTQEGELVKTENHYIKPKDFTVSDASRKIHGITDSFLQNHGRERAEVMQLLQKDLYQYKPLVVAHFMQLDYHMLSLGFYRAGLENPLPSLTTFCTMKFTADYRRPYRQRYLRLSELYQSVFNQHLGNEHNALEDAQATASCFFELWKRGEISEKTILQQSEHYAEPTGLKQNGMREISPAFMVLMLGILLVLIVLTLWLYGG